MSLLLLVRVKDVVWWSYCVSFFCDFVLVFSCIVCSNSINTLSGLNSSLLLVLASSFAMLVSFNLPPVPLTYSSLYPLLSTCVASFFPFTFVYLEALIPARRVVRFCSSPPSFKVPTLPHAPCFRSPFFLVSKDFFFLQVERLSYASNRRFLSFSLASFLPSASRSRRFSFPFVRCPNLTRDHHDYIDRLILD